MILSDKKIREVFLSNGWLVPGSLEKSQVQPASIDLTLGNRFKRIASTDEIDFDKGVNYIDDDLEYIEPRSFILGTTQETIKLPPFIGAMVSGRSSIGRSGLFVENAGWIDPGFKGKITLELFNASNFPIKKPVGRRICQIIFYELTECCSNPYGSKSIGSKYQNQDDVQGSLIHLDKEINDG